MSESPAPMGIIERSAHDGLRTRISDNVEEDRFEVTVGDQVVGWQPYRRYRGHIVLLATEVDTQWRDRGISSAMIGDPLCRPFPTVPSGRLAQNNERSPDRCR